MRNSFVKLGKNSKILITGAAGFIGFHLARRLLTEEYQVYGIDNLNDYYDVRLKEARLEILNQSEHFTFRKGNIADEQFIKEVFSQFEPDIVVNLAAQAGVRYSIENPGSYMESNVMGFYQILEACRHSYDEGKHPSNIYYLRRLLLYTEIRKRYLFQFQIRWIIRSAYMLQLKKVMN